MPSRAAPRFENAAQAGAWLDARINYETRLDSAAYGDFAASLSAFRGRMARVGDPQRGMKTIHIAGTRGKGSAALMLEALLRASGLKTAVFTSPHLAEYRERIRLDGEPVSDADFAGGLEKLAAAETETQADETEQAGGHAFKTVFETLTALFFMLAREARADWLVVETGLGGRLDATNIIDAGPVLWTRIGLDHTHLLGPTLERIASEKAAILKPGGWAVMGAQEGEAEQVFLARARETAAPCVRAAELCPLESIQATPTGLRVGIVFEGRRWVLDLPIMGLFQAENLQNALTMLAELRRRGEIPRAPDEALVAALQLLELPARMALYRWPGGELIVDGAHDPTGARALAASMAAHFPKNNATNIKSILCAAMMRDKDHDGFFRELAQWPGWSEVWCATLDSPRALSAEGLADAARRHFPPDVPIRVFQNIEQMLASLGEAADGRMDTSPEARRRVLRAVAAGSFYAAARFSAWGGHYVGASGTGSGGH